jgi:hypothetical protein
VILGLHGKMGAGKNEAAKRLARLSGALPVVEVSFAASLKRSAAAALGVTVPDLERWKNDPEAWVLVDVGGQSRATQSVRSFLQRYGTEAHRDVFGSSFWVDAAMPADGEYDDAMYVVTDVRFANEAQRVRFLGGYVVLIHGDKKDTGSHPSEALLDDADVDFVIDNSRRDDGFESLDRQLVSMLTEIARREEWRAA